MKNTIKTLGLIALVAVIGLSIGFSLAACDNGNTGGGGDPGGHVWVDGVVGKTADDNDVIVMNTAASKLVSMEGTDSDRMLVFENLDEICMPKPGDIIVSLPSEVAPHGFLYRVESVETDIITDREDSRGIIDGLEKMVTKVFTRKANIDEAVDDADTKETPDVDFEVDEGSEEDDEGVIKITVDKKRKSIKLEVDKTIEGVNLNGFIEFSSKINCKVDIKGYSMKYFELTAQPQLKAELEASIGDSFEKEKVFKIFEKELPPIDIQVGPIPVIIVPEISFEVIVSAKGEVKVSAQLVKWNYAYVFGVKKPYDGKDLEFYKENASEPAEYLKGVQLDLSGEVKVQPELSLMFGIYDVAFVGVSGAFYARLAGESGAFVDLEGNVDATAELGLYCGIEFAVKTKLEIFKIKLGELEGVLFRHEWDIWKKTWSSVKNVILDPLTATLAVGTTRSIIATVQPDDAISKKVTWSSSDPSVAGVTDGKVTAVGPGTATITATTASGNKTANCTINVAYPLHTDTWKEDSIESSDWSSSKYYSFYGIPGSTYYIWLNDKSQGDGSKTLHAAASAKYINGTSILEGIYNAYNTAKSFQARGEYVIIDVSSFYNKLGGDGTDRYGTFAIAYSTTNKRPGLTVPATPANVRVTGVTSTSIAIEWDAVPGAEGYYLYQRDQQGIYQKIATVTTSLGANVTKLAPNMTGRFKVSAFNSAGESEMSGEVVGTTSSN